MTALPYLPSLSLKLRITDSHDVIRWRAKLEQKQSQSVPSDLHIMISYITKGSRNQMALIQFLLKWQVTGPANPARSIDWSAG